MAHAICQQPVRIATAVEVVVVIVLLAAAAAAAAQKQQQRWPFRVADLNPEIEIWETCLVFGSTACAHCLVRTSGAVSAGARGACNGTLS